MKNFEITYVDGSQKVITGDRYDTPPNGQLLIWAEDGKIISTIAEGQWRSCRVIEEGTDNPPDGESLTHTKG